MIYKGKLDKTNNVEIIEFGDGTTEFQAGYIANSETKFILFKSCPPSNIGISKSDAKNSNDFEPEVAIVFKNRESFDLVYDYMSMVKNLYIMDEVDITIKKEDNL